MVFSCEVSLFLTLSVSLPVFNPLAMPQALDSSSPGFKHREKGGKWEWDGLPLFKRRLSKCLMHYNEKRHLYSHKALSVCALVCPFTGTEYLRPLKPSLTVQSSTLFRTYFFHPPLPKHPHNNTPPPPPTVNARVPCFPLGCPMGCVNVPRQLCNVIS